LLCCFPIAANAAAAYFVPYQPPMHREWPIYLVLLLITAAIFWPVNHYEFVNYDDNSYVTENPQIQQGLTPATIVWCFRAVVAGNWHPVTCLSLLIDHQLFGNNAGGYHLVNLLFHVANTLLLLYVLRRMTGEFWASAMTAALFAWHPLHVESVAWVSERKDVLSTFFGLLTLWAYWRYTQKRSKVEPSSLRFAVPGSRESSETVLQALDPRRWMLDYYLALLFFALGLMSKPMLVTLPIILLLLDFWPLRRIPGRATIFSERSTFGQLVLEKAPFFLLSIASGVATFFTQHEAGAMGESTQQFSFSARLANALASYVLYLGKTVWPGQLAVFYPRPPVWPPWQIAGSAVLLLTITFIAVSQARRRPFLLFGWLWFLCTLLPVIGLVQVGSQSMADRYLYIPSIGLFVMLAWGVKEFLPRQLPARLSLAVVMAAAMIGCLFTTSRQLRYWQNSETLFRHTIEVTPANVIPHVKLGEALIDKGQIDEGIRQLDEALELDRRVTQATSAPPNNRLLAYIHWRMADALASRGRIQESIGQYDAALRYQPDLFIALNNLAWILATDQDSNVRNGPKAVQLAERACELTNYKQAIMVGTLAAAYAEAGRFDDAIATAQKACALASESGDQDLLKRNQDLLALYRKHQPYHEPLEKLVPAAP
jgi:tetratricopeptide (TPR) repeat protein